MRFLIVFMPLFLFAFKLTDLIIKKINKIENYKKKFVVFPNYDLFDYKIKAPVYSIVVPKKVEKPKKEKKVKKKPVQKYSIEVEAVFNNQVCLVDKCYKKGDMIYGWKLIYISVNKIILQKGEEKKVIDLDNTKYLRIKK